MFFKIDQEVSLVSYSELQFVKAESLLATGWPQENIKEAYFNGIKSSFSSSELSEEDFDNYVAQDKVSPESISLNEIMI